MSDIIRAQSAESICAHRDAALRMLEEGLNLLAKAEQEYALATSGGSPEGARSYYSRGLTSWDRSELYDITEGKLGPLIEKYRVSLDGTAWAFLRDVTGLRNLMDATALAEFDKRLSTDPPQLTMENIQATFDQANENKDEIFERGVLEVFNEIKRSSRKYKTSDPGEIGQRFILRSMLDSWGGMSYTGRKRAMIDDLERILCVVDGRSPPDNLASAGALINAHARQHGNKGIVYTQDMEVSLCKNGNIHVNITNDAARAKVNRIVAKHYRAALPDDTNRPAREK